MAWQPGGSLAARLHGGAVRWAARTAERVLLLERVAEGVALLHSAEPRLVVQSDIKSGNVLLASLAADAEPRLSDFGLAELRKAAATQAAALTARAAAGAYAGGTASYKAPEMYRSGRAAPALEASRSTDVYALATLAWEVLVGERPWYGFDEAERVLALRGGENLDFARLPDDAPAALAALLARGAALDRAARPSAHELCDGLRAAREQLESGRFDAFVSHCWEGGDHAPATSFVLRARCARRAAARGPTRTSSATSWARVEELVSALRAKAKVTCASLVEAARWHSARAASAAFGPRNVGRVHALLSQCNGKIRWTCPKAPLQQRRPTSSAVCRRWLRLARRAARDRDAVVLDGGHRRRRRLRARSCHHARHLGVECALHALHLLGQLALHALHLLAQLALHALHLLFQLLAEAVHLLAQLSGDNVAAGAGRGDEAADDDGARDDPEQRLHDLRELPEGPVGAGVAARRRLPRRPRGGRRGRSAAAEGGRRRRRKRARRQAPQHRLPGYARAPVRKLSVEGRGARGPA